MTTPINQSIEREFTPGIMKPHGPMSQEASELLKYLGRGGKWQYFWQDRFSPPIWFEVGRAMELPAWSSVYFNVNPGRDRLAGTSRGGIENIAAVNCLFAEFDQKDGRTLAEIEALSIKPSVIVASGGGWHCYWLLEEPEIVGEKSLNYLKELQYKWVMFTGGDPGAKDLSRVLRVPGTWNNKPQYESPRPVEIIKFDLGLQYMLSELSKEIIFTRFITKGQPNAEINDMIKQGTRNSTLTSAAGTLVNRGFQESEIRDLLLTTNQTLCQPPLPEAEVRTIVHSVARYISEDNPRKSNKPTDDDLADRFIAMSPITAYGIGEWKRYQNGIWNPMGDDAVENAVLDVLKNAKSEGIRPTKNLLKSVVELVRLRVSVPAEKWDADRDIVIFRNGALHIPSMALLLHNPGYYATFGLDFNYDPSATAKSWESFLKTTIPEAASFLQEFSGLALTTDTSYEVATWLVGPPASGKSTFLEGLQTMLGNRAIQLGLAEIERSRFALGDIAGKTLAVASEQPAIYVQASHLLNMLISGEKIRIERKFKDPVEIIPHVKIAWAMNELPRIPDAGNGLFRRVKIIEFPALDAKKRDLQLKERIRGEGPGILNWALEGLIRLRARGWFEYPACVLSATEEFQTSNDIPNLFISERCISGRDYKVQSQALYEAYHEWCDDNGHKPMSSTAVATEWKRLGFSKYNSNGKKYWKGIGLLTNQNVT